MEAIIFHFPHISILWYFLTVVPVIKTIKLIKNTLRFTCFTFPHCASSNGLHGRIHNHTDYISTLSVFKCVLKMPAQLDKKLHQLQFFWFSPLWLFNGFPMTLLPEHKKSTRMPGATRCCFALRLPFLWLEVRGGRLTSLDASFMRCFGFFKHRQKHWGRRFFKTSLKHCIVKQKVRCFRPGPTMPKMVRTFNTNASLI